MSDSRLIDLGWKKRVLTLLLGCVIAPLRLVNTIFVRRKIVDSFLILEPFGLGDVISLQPMVHALSRKGDVTIFGKASWRSLYPRIEWMNAEIPWSSYDPKHKYGWRQYLSRDFLSFISNSRKLAKGSIGIDSRGDIRSVLLLYLVGCKRVFTLSHYLGSNLKNPGWVGRIVPFRADMRRWENNFQFASWFIPDAVMSSGPRFEELLQAGNKEFTNKVVGFVPVAPWEGKLWGPDKWRALAEHMRCQGWEVRVLCGPGQSQSAAREAGENEITPVECRSIGDWVAQLGQLNALVSLDSGPMHLADALGVPVIALFGQGTLPLWAPSGVNSRVVSHQSDQDFRQCIPIPANAEFARRFMKRITVEEVLAALREVNVL